MKQYFQIFMNKLPKAAPPMPDRVQTIEAPPVVEPAEPKTLLDYNPDLLALIDSCVRHDLNEKGQVGNAAIIEDARDVYGTSNTPLELESLIANAIYLYFQNKSLVLEKNKLAKEAAAQKPS